ncbi:TPA: hypothetical protein N0F65_005918 [Lagenidium giganteum]|uniref:Uncharacterized protein n=1 Tax=Lagenidium giganteum TaxID=4803 RepID=A0AAV2Z6B6_9STRA|nr:TPA: hypothetical protein N0F65_005918 [Lagenidium giganteum]
MRAGFADDLSSDDDDACLERTYLRELRAKARELEDVQVERDELERKVVELTSSLEATTREIDERMALWAEATERLRLADEMESSVKKSVLSQEMALHEQRQKVTTLMAQLETANKERSHWESEFLRVSALATQQERARKHVETQQAESEREHTRWKTAALEAQAALKRLTTEHTALQAKQVEIVATMEAMKATLEERETHQKARAAKRDAKIKQLVDELTVLRVRAQQADEDARAQAEKLQAAIASNNTETQQELHKLRARVAQQQKALGRATASEALLRQEVCKLREGLVLSEETRKSEQRRHEQIVRGKEREAEFIWRHAVVGVERVTMEELSFFNEREAECFEREDTLSLSDLEKLNVNEDMPEMERTEQLLRTGLEKQKISVLMSLPKILASNNSKNNLVVILDCIKHESEANSNVIHEMFKGISSLACATVDGKVLGFPMIALHDEYEQQLKACREEKKDAVYLLSDEQVTKLLVPLTLDIVSEIQQKDYAEAASLSIIATLPRLGGGLKKTQVIRVAIEKGDVSQAPGSRLICCLLLGAVTALNLLSTQDIEGLYFQKMMAMCQDTDAEIRKCMCIQLDALARAVGEEKASAELLPELLELLQDEEEQVKQTAFLALLSLFDFFPAVERTKRIVPELVTIVEAHPEYLVSCLAEQYGAMSVKLATLSHLTSDVAPTFLEGYSQLSARDDPQIRAFCAYNFPAMLQAFGPPFYSALLDDLLVKFCHDSTEKVRLHAAAGLHEVALLLGQQRSQRYVKPLFLMLIKDEATAVQGTAISRVPQVMELLLGAVDDDQKSALIDGVVKAIVQYHGNLPASRNRDQLVFIEALGELPSWVSSVQMYETIIPILFDLVEEGARPVQLAAMRIIIKCIRRNEVAAHRFSLLSKLRGDYGHARSYWRRLLYLDACAFALEFNSRQYCRLNYLDIAVELIEDPIPNVRLKAVSLLPQWKNAVMSFNDDKIVDRIRQFMDDGAVDTDRDVASAAYEARQAIEASDMSAPRRPPEDAEDKRKLAEEENLSLISDHEDTSADSKWSNMLEYTLVVGKDGQVVRRARVKSLDLINKLSRTQGGKPNGPPSGSNGSAGGALLSATSPMSIPMKTDASKLKTVPKTPNKPASVTTLPNCPTARPGNSKAPQAMKVMGSSGKLTTGNGKAAIGATRVGSGSNKDAGALTKIPIIRPTAPAKRENSPSTSTRPGVANSGANGGAGGGSRLGTIDATGGNAALRPKATAPLTSKR